MSLKSGSDIRLKKDTDFLQVSFVATPAPVPPTIASGVEWSVLDATATATSQQGYFLWEDVLDITGVQMADLSMVNQGSGVVRRGIVAQGTLYENLNIIDAHVISLVPLNLSALEWLSLVYGLDRSLPLSDDRLLMVNVQSYKRGQQDASFTFSQNDGAVYGSASTFSNTRLHLYRYVAMIRNSYVSAAGPGAPPTAVNLAGDGVMQVPSTSFAQLCRLEEFNAVATAYAIYRGNEVQQTYDNP